MSKRRRAVFATVAVACASLLPALTLFAIDVHLHGKYEKSAGFNVWGYRGPVVGRKQPGEYRVVFLGGSAAYGYGVDWADAIPAQLEKRLASVEPGRRVSVVNLGYNNEGAYSFRFTLEDYRSLDYDLAVLYEGYNDLMGDPRAPNVQVFRHESAVFRLTGYLPIFPIVFQEKAAALMSRGDTGALYRQPEKTVFRPGLATRTTAEILRAAGQIGESLDRQARSVAPDGPAQIPDPTGTGCAFPWGQYCRSIADAVDFTLAHGQQVLVLTQPYEVGDLLRQRHQTQQREMAALLERRYTGNPRVRYVNLGDLVDLSDPALSFDRMHLTVAGNARVAAALVGPVLEMVARRETRH